MTTGASFNGSGSNTRGGWLVGGGIEWAVTNNWTVKAEYDYLGLSSQSYTLPAGMVPALVGDTFATSSSNVQMVKVGANYLFNWGGR